MTRPRPPYLLRETARGQTFWYVRKGKGPRVRIRGEYGSAEFLRQYHAAIKGECVEVPNQTQSGQLSWLVQRYQDSLAWEKLSTATHANRSAIYRAATKRAGEAPLSAIDAATMRAAIRDRAGRPFAANAFLKAMRGLFRWAEKAGLAEDPTKGIEGYPHKTEGFHSWTEEEIASFEERWPVGSRERLSLALLLYTGLRRGDVVRLGRQHIRNGMITLRTEKTGCIVTIPVLPELAAIINASPTSELAFISGSDGRPMTKESFGNWFRQACRAAGVPGRAHGLRKAGAARAAENGATEAQLRAIFGWGDMSKEPAHYTRAASRKRLAMEAMGKLRK